MGAWRAGPLREEASVCIAASAFVPVAKDLYQTRLTQLSVLISAEVNQHDAMWVFFERARRRCGAAELWRSRGFAPRD